MAANGRRFEHKNLDLAFVLASLHTGSSQVLWPAVVERCIERDVNLFCFPGGRLGATEAYEVQRNTAFTLVKPGVFDGLLTWASSLGGVLDQSEVARFHDCFRDIPMLSLSQSLPGVPCVALDSYEGMCGMLEHLICGHGYTEVAFIRGPENHPSAKERLRAYTDVLREHKIAYRPELVASPLHWDMGGEAVRELLDERKLIPGKDFKAIVAASDLLALMAFKILRARGYSVPGDVALSGFNDSIESKLVTPPLTTVSVPFRQQGRRAVDALVQRVRGVDIPDNDVLPPKLTIRRSCGCQAEGTVYQGPALEPETIAEQLRELLELEPEYIDAWIHPLLFALNDGNTAFFFAALEGIMDRIVSGEHDVHSWQNALTMLRTYYGPSMDGTIDRARLVVADAAQRAETYKQWHKEQSAERLREIGRELLMTFDLRRLCDVLYERLPALGIKSAYMVLYNRTGGVESDAELALAFHEKERIDLRDRAARIPAGGFVPVEFFPKGRSYRYVVEPLFFQDGPIGYVLFEIGPKDGAIYEELRSYLSSALKAILLFDEVRHAREVAEKADRIKTRLLANVSHELRTPLKLIIDLAAGLPGQTATGAPDLSAAAGSIERHAKHQLGLINDLLDLSRAEIDELELHKQILDPAELLRASFDAFRSQSHHGAALSWKLNVPERLPAIVADELRLKQIVFNLLSNAVKFTGSGGIELGAQLETAGLRIWVADTGPGIPSEHSEHIFESFVSLEPSGKGAGGIGLGLSIARHMAMLHGGTLTLARSSREGSRFDLLLPLPRLGVPSSVPKVPSDDLSSVPGTGAPKVLLVIAARKNGIDPAIEEFARRCGLEVYVFDQSGQWESQLETLKPSAIAWDLSGPVQNDWAVVRRLRHHPSLMQAPFLLYAKAHDGLEAQDKEPVQFGLTSFVSKGEGGLMEILLALSPEKSKGPILIVDDEEETLTRTVALITKAFPDFPIRSARDGSGAMRMMERETPSLVVLDYLMVGFSGADVLDQMRSIPALASVPAVILTNKVISFDDVARIERHARVLLQNKDIWTDEESVSALHRALFGADTLPAHTSQIVKRSIAYLGKHFPEPISRWQIAEAVHVSEDYLSRIFHRELGLSPWEYLNRYRVHQAKTMLRSSADSIRTVAEKVGFSDQAYFSRVFRKVTGTTAQEFRDNKSE